jgi:hypothetical protein
MHQFATPLLSAGILGTLHESTWVVATSWQQPEPAFQKEASNDVRHHGGHSADVTDGGNWLRPLNILQARYVKSGAQLQF